MSTNTTAPPPPPSRLGRHLRAEDLPRATRLLLGTLSLAIAAALWLPLVHVLFRAHPTANLSTDPISPEARALAARHMELWTQPDLRLAEVARMRRSNAEWDFMGRTFLVLALANMSLRAPEEAPRYLEVADRVIDETLRLEREQGMRHFFMGYGTHGEFLSGVDRSLFVDGEIALMLGARRLAGERADLRPLMRERIDAMLAYMRASPTLCGESYPDECWTFCNAVALAAIRMDEALEGRDHVALLGAWVTGARARLVDGPSGLLVSSFSRDGVVNDGPEGSSIWLVAHMLQTVDPAFARDQYDRAKGALARRVLGFGYAVEWPATWTGPADIDSGPVVPLLDVSAGSSGMALIGAAAFGDAEYLAGLRTTLDFAAFPTRSGDALRYGASNQVGDAVLLYASVMGPLWEKLALSRERTR